MVTLRLILLGLAPLSLLAFLNVRVYSAIQSNSNLRQRSYSVILLLIVSIFIICQLPRIVILQTFSFIPQLMSQDILSFFYILSLLVTKRLHHMYEI